MKKIIYGDEKGGIGVGKAVLSITEMCSVDYIVKILFI